MRRAAFINSLLKCGDVNLPLKLPAADGYVADALGFPSYLKIVKLQ